MKNKKSPLLSIYFFILYIYTCASTSYATIGEGGGVIISLIPAVLGVIVAVQKKINFLNNNFLLIMGVFIIWNVVLFIVLQRPPSPYPFIVLFVAAIAYHAFKDDFIDRFVDLTVMLSVIGLIVWGLCLISYSGVESFGEKYGIESQNVSYSFFVFNIPINHKGTSIARNCGCCWEPGRYACMLVIALFFYFLRNGMNFKTKKFWVLTLSLVTTFSTTGYIVFIVLITIWVICIHKLNPLYLISIALLVAVVWNLPFMGEKVFELITDQDNAVGTIDVRMYQIQHGSDKYYTPQRFEAMYLQWINFVNMPLLTGEGRNLTKHYINRTYGVQLTLSEGILGIFVRYGLIISLFCYYSLLKSSILFASCSKYKVPPLLFFILFVLVNFSYYFWEYPLFALLWCWFFFESPKSRINIIR